MWGLDTMDRVNWQDRISVAPGVHRGEACIKGTRVPVRTIVGSFADAMAPEQILTEYPQLTLDDIHASLAYAAEVLRKEVMQVSSSEDDPLPAPLYRYMSWHNACHKKLLTDNELHFAVASSFNDPFDCQFEIEWPEDPVLLRKCLEKEAMKDDLNESPDELRARVDKRSAEILAPGFAERQTRLIREDADQNAGLLCLSKTRSNLLMWGHYADSHGGLCVGFSLAGLEEVLEQIHKEEALGGDIIRVEYADRFPVFKIAERPPPGEMLRTAVRTKSLDWSYEREYRCVVGLKDNARTWCYPDHALVEVILGCRIHPADEQEIVEILQRKNPRPPLFKAVIRKGEYALDFHPVEY